MGDDTWQALALSVEGVVAATPCLAFTLYLYNTDGEGILNFYHRAREALGERITHYRTGTMRRRARLTARAETTVPTWCTRLRPALQHGYYQIGFFGCDEAVGITSASIDMSIAHHPPDPDPEAARARRRQTWPAIAADGAKFTLPCSSLRVTVPLDHPLAQAERFREWVLGFSLVRDWPFLSGQAGYAMHYFASVGSNAVRLPMQQHLGAVCRRHPGLDCEMGGFRARLLRYEPRWMERTGDLLAQVKRVNWLTLVTERTLEYLGGSDAVRHALADDDTIEVHTLTHGLAIQAGPAPALGDLGRRRFLPAYRRVARVLRPARIEALDGLGRGCDEEAVNEWLDGLDRDYP